jgi:HPt (histidine-containing phosphotransfer) domain-containing protein
MSQQDALQAQLLELKRAYARQLPDKVAKVEEACRAFLAAPREELVASNAYRLAHSLAGSSGTYGYPELCAAARSAEALLKESLESRSPLSPGRRDELAAHLSRLKELATAASNSLLPPSP